MEQLEKQAYFTFHLHWGINTPTAANGLKTCRQNEGIQTFTYG